MDRSAAWKTEYPFQSHWLELEDARYHFLDEGRGSPVLMVHGNPTWSFYWRKLIQAVRESHRAIAPDHIGSGLSSKPPTYRYRLQQHTDNLIRLIQHLDLNDITVVVHDWGGAIGLGAAVAEPQRFARLVILNTGAFPPPYIPWRIRVCRTPLLGEFGVRGLNLFARAAQRMAMHDRSKVSDVALAGLIAPYDCWTNRIGIDRFVQDIPHATTHPTYATLKSLEQNLVRLQHLPTRIIWGMRDWCFRPECLERFEQAFPHAETHRLPDVGHWVMEEAADEVMVSVRDFMKSAAQHHEETALVEQRCDSPNGTAAHGKGIIREGVPPVDAS